MDGYQSYPYPEVFLVDRGERLQHSDHPPGLIPCWSSMPTQEEVRGRQKSAGGSSTGVNWCAAMMLLLLFLLVFAALGIGAYQIHNMQVELGGLREGQPVAPQKQVGVYEARTQEDKNQDKTRSAAHVIGRIETSVFHKTLRWESKVGQAFTSGAVAYRVEDGGLQVNESGIYHVYSRVELIFRSCPLTSSLSHSVFVRRKEHPVPLTLMDAHRTVQCPADAQRSWMSESYLAASVQLQRYDRVYVNVSHPAHLSHENYANFFGLYMI